MIETLLYIAAGCVLGIFTGLLPGIHINTVSIILIGLNAGKSLNLVFLIISMSIVHSFVDFIPSILLGAPNSENYLSVLPGHRLLLKGKGYYAIKLAIFGSTIGCILSIFLIPLYFLIIADSISFISYWMPFLLAFFLILMAFSEKNPMQKIFTTIIIIFSGIAGFLVLQGNLSIKEPLFPVITGFFGIPTILESIKSKSAIHVQSVKNFKISEKKLLRNSFFGVLAGSIVSFLPSIGPNQSTFILSKFAGKIKTSSYLVILGGVGISNMLFSFFTLYALGKTRTGIAAAIKQLIELQEQHLPFIIAVILVSTAFGVISANFLAKKLLNKIQKIDYRMLGISILLFMVLLVFLFSGTIGLLVLATTSSIGFLSIKLNVKRSNCMAFLVIPTIIIYLELNAFI